MAAPTVTAISPSTGSTLGGTTVNVFGTGFSVSAVTVFFGSAVASNVIVEGDTFLSCAAPPTSVSGEVDITVENTDGTSGTSSADEYTFVYPLPDGTDYTNECPYLDLFGNYTLYGNWTFALPPSGPGAGWLLAGNLNTGGIAQLGTLDPAPWTMIANGQQFFSVDTVRNVTYSTPGNFLVEANGLVALRNQAGTVSINFSSIGSIAATTTLGGMTFTVNSGTTHAIAFNNSGGGNISFITTSGNVELTSVSGFIRLQATTVEFTDIPTTVQANVVYISPTTGAISNAPAPIGGGINWIIAPSTNFTLVKGNGYIVTNSGSTTINTPTTCSIGEVYAVTIVGSGTFTIQLGVGQTFSFVVSFFNTSVTSVNSGDTIFLVCIQANVSFQVVSAIGAEFIGL